MERGDFLELFATARARHELLVALCNCEVTYSGRAEAFLPRGDRVIMIKQDGVLLVHQPEHGNPINYLKAGAEIGLEKFEGHLKLHGRFAKEYLEVEIYRVYDAMARRLDDGQRQTLQGSEADMSDMLRANPALIAKDFKPLNREEQTEVGFIDLFGHDGKGNLVCIECKRYTAGLSAVSQLHRYVEKIKQIKGTEAVRGVMAAPKVTANALSMLHGYGYDFVAVRPPKRLERHDKQQSSLEAFQ